MSAAWLLAAALCVHAAAPVVRGPEAPRALALIHSFRVQAGLPPLAPQAVARLAAAPAPTLAAAQVEAARALLVRVPPAFKAEADAADAPRIAELKAAVTAARTVVARAEAERRAAELAYRLAPKGAVDEEALRPLYEGSRALSVAEALRVPGVSGQALRELLLDGDPEEAGRLARRLRLSRPDRRRLEAELAAAKPSPAVASLRRHAASIEKQVSAGRYAEALLSARRMLELVQASGLRENTKRFLGALALTLDERARNAGAPRLYGSRSMDGEERVRVQKHGDCAVHQLYNHPALAAVRALLPYERFLPAVERLVGSPVRRKGMADHETRQVLRALGFEARRLYSTPDADALAAHLSTHGPLLATLRWTKPRSFRERGGDHAVLVRSAFKEKGAWRFVVIDSNYPRPQAYAFEELQVLRGGDFAAVEPRAGADAAALARAFAAKHGAPDKPWYLRLFGG